MNRTYYLHTQGTTINAYFKIEFFFLNIKRIRFQPMLNKSVQKKNVNFYVSFQTFVL